MLIKDIMNLLVLEIIFSFSLFIGILYIVLSIQDYLYRKRVLKFEKELDLQLKMKE